MKILILTALALFSVTIAHEEVCRFKIPVTTSNLKCGDQVYHRDAAAISAINECGAGKNGAEIALSDILCIFVKLGFSKNNVLLKDAAAAADKKAFPYHHEAISKGVNDCHKAYIPGDPHQTVDCLLKLYEDVCGHKTCDWFNTLD